MLALSRLTALGQWLTIREGDGRACNGPSFLPSSRWRQLPMDKTSFIKRFIFNAGPSIVSVSFIKADGSLRKLVFNPRDAKEIKGTGTPSAKPNIVRCRDFAVARKEGQGAWRSFDCERVVSIKANGQTVAF